MGDNIESAKTSKEMESLSLQNRIPRDLLQRFMEVRTSRQNELNVESGEIELNLGLSLGGRFGVDKSSSNLLVRSSSIAGAIPLVREEPEVLTPPATAAYAGLSRTSSLPVETEEEWRKRKEIQSLRRMEAKRRRSEKQRASKGDGSNKEGEIEVNLRGRGGGGGQRQQYVADMNKVGSSVAPPLGLPSWAAAARQTILGGGIEALIARGRTKIVGGSGQASIDSQGGCSSSMSEMESTKAPPVSSSSGDISPAAIQSARNRSDQNAVGSSRSKSVENAGRPPRAEVQNPTNRTEATGSTASGTNSLEDMPCVFTKGDGPNGRRIEGILYKYGKGEDVRIMCVCHGDFYSPAGFVKHAGGTDIAHPLKHIVVNPNSS